MQPKKKRAALDHLDFKEVNDKDIDYDFLSSNQHYSSHSLLVPLQSATAGARVFYGAKFFNQYVPLKNAEVPLVQSADDEGNSFYRTLGDTAGNVSSKVDGTVVDVTPDYLTIKGADGKKHTYDLYNDFPFNRMSVTGDTQVYVKRNGHITKLKIENYKFNKGDLVLSITNDLKSCWKPITDFIVHDTDKTMYRVEFKSGRHVTVTEDHSLIEFKDGELLPIYAKDCIIGETRSPVVFQEVEHTASYDVKLGVLVGLYLSEGWTSKKQNLISIAVKGAERQKEILQLLETIVFPDNSTVTPNKPQEEHISFTSKFFKRFVEHHCGRGSSNKFISDYLLYETSKAFKHGLIQGLFAGDGCLHSDVNNSIQLEYGTCSIKLRSAIVDLLGQFKVFTTLQKRVYKNEWNDLYKLRVSSCDISKLDTWFFYQDRQQKLETLLNPTYRNSPYDGFIPSWDFLEQQKELFKGSRCPSSLSKFEKTKKRVLTKAAALKAGIMVDFATTESKFDIVTAVIKLDTIQETVYDFSVEGTERFAVENGLIVHNTQITSIPLIQKGAQVKAGQLLARSNFTSDDGSLTTGANARVGLVPYKGFSMDDAVAISEDFAKRLTSEEIASFTQSNKNQIKTDKKHFSALFPSVFKKEQLELLDDNGVVKPGTVLKKGDPITLATKPRTISSQGLNLKKLSRGLANSRTDASQVWEYDSDGIVTNVANTKDGYKVIIKTHSPAKLGDKISLRSGQKGIISKIIPQDHMPRTEDGNPLEILLNPMGIPSRVNNGGIYELILGKIAAKTGKPYKIPQFLPKGEKWYDFVQSELDKHGITDTEKVYDPLEDKWLQNPILVGNGHILKLSHMAKKKLSARGLGSYSTTTGEPAKGGGDAAQSKRLSGLETTSLLSSGAYNTLRETATLRGAKNDDYWRAVRQGLHPNPPKEPFAWNKFKALIMGAGMSADEVEKGKFRLAPFTDKKLDYLNPVEIENGEILDMNTLAPKEGGLFSTSLTTTNKWGKVTLPTPIPNPAFETVIKKLTGLSSKEFDATMAGKQSFDGLTGPAAIAKQLSMVDLDKLEAEAHANIKSGKKTKRPLAIARLNFIEGLRKNKLTPKDLMINKVPVIPPVFRPFSMMGDTFLPGDANELYGDLLEMKNTYNKTQKILGEQEANEIMPSLYNSVKAVYGYGDPVNVKTKERGVSGFLSKLVGKQAKFSYVNRHLLSKNVDLSGRSVITADPELGMDEIGIPEKMAWKMYQPFVQRRLVRGGLSPAGAIRAIKDKDKKAKHALESEMKERPVMYSRAPVWHKFGIVGGWPKIVDDNSIHANLYSISGMGGDFDGDTYNVHVPIQPKTIEEVKEKLMPSKMLFSIREEEKVMAQPRHESLLGLFTAMKRPAKNKHRFKTKADALKAIKQGHIDLSDEVEIG
jgi:hypothetical protein